MSENKNVVAQARVDVNVIKHTDVIFKRIGITRSRAIEIFLLKVVEHNGLPFELKIPKIKGVES